MTDPARVPREVLEYVASSRGFDQAKYDAMCAHLGYDTALPENDERFTADLARSHLLALADLDAAREMLRECSDRLLPFAYSEAHHSTEYNDGVLTMCDRIDAFLRGETEGESGG
jgi:hypothetical protein